MSGFTRRLMRLQAVATKGGGTTDLTHGDQVTQSNTGPRTALTAVSGDVVLSTSNVGTLCTGSGTQADPYVYANKSLIGGGISFSTNVNNFYFVIRDCLAPGGMFIATSRTGPIVRAEWCGFGSRTDYVGGTSGVVGTVFDLYRCWVDGGSDGLRMQGAGSVATECHIRVRQGSTTDHNDAVQNYGGYGDLTLLRCYLDGYLYTIDNTGSGIYQGGDYGEFNSAVQTITFKDNYLNGAGIHWRMYGGQKCVNLQYVVTGNKHGRIGATHVYTTSKADDSTDPSQITWSNNTFADNGAQISL